MNSPRKLDYRLGHLLLGLGLAFALGCTPEPQGEDPVVDAATYDYFFPDEGTDGDVAIPDMAADQGADASIDAVVDAAEPPEALSINSIVPNRGPVSGGTAIRVIGSGFTEDMQIVLGGNACVDLLVESPNHLRCTSPVNNLGTVPVSVIRVYNDLREQADLPEAFTYYAEVSVTEIVPSRIPVRGGTEITIRGTGLIDGTQVTIDGERASNVEVNEEGTALQALSPPGDPGPAHVSVTNFNGSAAIRGGIYYFEEIAVDRADPPVGPLAGGTAVTLHGTGLTADSRVDFVPNNAEVQGASEERTTLDVSSPPAFFPGLVDIAVENENGQATLRNAFLYFDPAAEGFSVAGIAPNSGPVEGGASVFVAGSGFSAQTVVRFDGREIDCVFLDANRLECTSPPSPEGPVDVSVDEDGETILLADGYTYFQSIDLIAIIPDRGSIAGGTLVTVSGSGFTADMQFNLGELELVDAQFIDDTTIVGMTPPNTAGPVDVRATTEFARSTLHAGFTYYDPVADFGGAWGEAIEGNINITVIHAYSGERIPDVALLVVTADEALTLEGMTDASGQATISHPDLGPPVNVTAAKELFEVTTIEDVDVENITIFLFPNDGMGDPPPGVPGAILSGVASGLDVLPKPSNETYVNIIVIETSHSSPFNRTRLPPPGPGGLLFEDGPFEILARPGEIAIIATAGEIDRDILKDFQDGVTPYWTMRNSLNPLRIGLRRFISAAPGEEINNLDVVLDHPLDVTIPVDFDNPPRGPDPGPRAYAALPRLSFGPEGYWELDTGAFGLDPNLELRKMPSLDGWDADITFYMLGLAYSLSDDFRPMSVCRNETRDVEGGLLMGPFPGTAFVITPEDQTQLGEDRLITWGVHDGFEGPIHPPSANLVLIEEPALGPPKPLWRYVTPSLVTEVEVPELPAAAGGAGLGGGVMFLTIMPFILSNGAFDFDDFTYRDLNQGRWRSWALTTTIFTQ